VIETDGIMPRAVLPDALIFEAESGQAGLDLYRSQTVDCVILELGLPDISGIEVLKQLSSPAGLPVIPVIVLTRLSYGNCLEIANQNGATATFVKSKHVRSNAPGRHS
jgi:CheY-like chemotaxis protein